MQKPFYFFSFLLSFEKLLTPYRTLLREGCVCACVAGHAICLSQYNLVLLRLWRTICVLTPIRTAMAPFGHTAAKLEINLSSAGIARMAVPIGVFVRRIRTLGA